MKKLLIFICVSVFQSLILQAAASSNEKIFGVEFFGVPKRTPLYDFVNNCAGFEQRLGNDNGYMTYKQRDLRFKFLRQLTKDRPADRLKALMLACTNFLPVSTALIIQSGISVDHLMPEIGSHPITPLLLAVAATPSQFPSTPLLKKLLIMGANVNLPCGTGETPLYAAVATGYEEHVSLLLRHGADPNIVRNAEHGRTGPLYLAAACGYLGIIELLLQYNADPNLESTQGAHSLSMAAEGGHVAAIRALAAGGATVNKLRADKSSALLLAVERGHPDAAHALLDLGADPNIVNSNGCTALIQAALYNRHEIMPWLMAHAADVEFQDSYGNTSLLLATCNNNVESVRMLLNPQWNPKQLLTKLFGPLVHRALNLPNEQGIWPLFYAAHKGYTEIFKLLVEAGASAMIKVEYPCGRHASLLTALAQSESADLSAILACCKDFNASHYMELSRKQPNGNYPIHDACKRKNTDVLRFFLACGADQNVLNNAGHTPRMVAMAAGNADAIAELNAHIEHPEAEVASSSQEA